MGGWWFALSGADGVGDARDLLTARHRAAPSTCEPLGGPGGRNKAPQSCLLKRKDVHEPLFRDWWFALSGADGAGDARDLLTVRHRKAPSTCEPLGGPGGRNTAPSKLPVEERNCRYTHTTLRYRHPTGRWNFGYSVWISETPLQPAPQQKRAAAVKEPQHILTYPARKSQHILTRIS